MVGGFSMYLVNFSMFFNVCLTNIDHLGIENLERNFDLKVKI
jgi:hypothetical protein